MNTSNTDRVVSNEDLLKQLHWRYATKVFDPAKKLSAADWKTIEDALVLSPSSFGLQPWKFFVVTSQNIKDQLVAASWNQRQVADASHVVVFAINTHVDEAFVDRFIKRTVEVRGGPAEALQGYRQVMVGAIKRMGSPEVVNAWATRQVYIALGNLMTAAAMLGIDVCPMEGIIPEKYDEILNLKEKGYKTVVVGAVGYRSATDKYATTPKVRYKNEDMVTIL
jgi:nitroreductase